MTLGFLGKATALYAIGNICLRAASFLLIPIYTHFLDIEDCGLLMTLLLTIQFMLVAMNCGTEHGLVRFAKHYEKNGQLNSLMGTTFVISCMASAVVACVSLTLLIPFFRTLLHRQEVYLLIAFVLSSAFFQSMCDLLTSYYRSQGQPIKYVVVGVATALMLTVISFVFLYVLRMGIQGALLAKIITHGWIFSVVAWQVYSKTGFHVSFKLLSKLFHFGAPLAMSGFGQFAVTGASIYFLGILVDFESVTFFFLGHKLGSVLLMVLVLPFQLSFQPYVFSQLDLPDIKKKMGRLLTYLVCAIAVGSFCVLFASRLLLPLITPSDYPAQFSAQAFAVTLLVMPAMALTGLFYYGETLLKAAQKSYLIGFVVVICAVISVLANYTLIRYFSWYGAILATNGTYLILGSSIFFIGLKEYSVPIEWRRLRLAVIMFVGVLVVNLLLLKSNLYLYCFASLAVAAPAAYFVVRGSFWDDSERYALRQMLQKVRAVVCRSPQKEVSEMSYEGPSGNP